MSLTIRAEAQAGDSIERTARLMQDLADLLSTGVEVKFNDVTLWAAPGGDARRLVEGYQRLVGLPPEPAYKLVTSRNPPVQGARS